jgi:hypothetical protein
LQTTTGIWRVGVSRIGMMQAITRHRVKEFDTSRKPHHWGKRKLKTDL